MKRDSRRPHFDANNSNFMNIFVEYYSGCNSLHSEVLQAYVWKKKIKEKNLLKRASKNINA